MTDDSATEMYRSRTDALTADVGAGRPIVFAHGT